MAFDFPSSPSENQTFTPPGGPTYIYKAPAWELMPTVDTTSKPNFSVHRNAVNQSGIANITDTKILFTTKRWDTGNYFDITANSRFLPLVAGTYLFLARATSLDVNSDGTHFQVSMRKNNAIYEYGSTDTVGFINAFPTSQGSWLAQMNGTTDYVDFWVWQNSGGSRVLNGAIAGTSAAGMWLSA